MIGLVATVSDLESYNVVLDEIVARLAAGQSQALLTVAETRIRTYHAVGAVIVKAQQQRGWGAKVIDRLAADLRSRFPDQTGLSPRNLRYMRDLALSWPDGDLATAVAKLPWTHVTVLLSRVPDPDLRVWYADQAQKNRWSKRFLEDRIQGQLHERLGAAPSNFHSTLEPTDAEQAQSLTRDPVLLEFLGLTETAREADVEQAMVTQITRTMLELGDGLAFVGRQVPVLVDDREYFLDLLFFSIPQARYIVVELKSGAFNPRDAGQLNFYVNLIDDQRRDHSRHAPTIGILLCGTHTGTTVRYALAGVTTPMAVAAYTYDALPADAQAAVPSEHDLTDNGR